MNLVHGVDAISLNFVVVDLGVAFDMRFRHLMPNSNHVFGYLAKDVVTLQS